MIKKVLSKKNFENKTSEVKKIPEGIIILSVIFFAVALIGIIFSGALFYSADIFSVIPSSELPTNSPTSIQILSLAFVFLFVSLLSYFVGRGLIKLDNRSRIVALILLVLNIVLFIYASIIDRVILKFSLIFIIVIHGVPIWYLLKKDIVKSFK